MASAGESLQAEPVWSESYCGLFFVLACGFFHYQAGAIL